MPFSDFAPTPSEVVSATRGGPANLATVHSAMNVIENRGVEAVGRTGVSDMLQGQPGLWSSGYSGNPFDASVVIRGFSNEAPNRVAFLVNGRSLNIPRTEVNTNFLFPETIERIEVIRGDATIQFGNNGIGGAVNVILKNPRLNPGAYFGMEAGSWRTDREWAGINLVRGPLAVGIFMGRYFQEGWRIYEGNGVDNEPVTRPGPWTLSNVTANLNWKITPYLTLDLMTTKSDQRVPYSDYIQREQWETRDLRNIYRQQRYDDGPDERYDTVTIGKLLYEGGRLGRLETIGSMRSYDRKSMTYASGLPSDQRWEDFGLSFIYSRNDEYGFLKNDLTLGSDLYDGKFRREARYPDIPYPYPPYNTIQWLHAGYQSGYRETISYYLMNNTTLWDRVVVGLGYRLEHYDLKNLYANNETRTVTNSTATLERKKSASQWSLGYIYDRELGSNVYYKHSRLYRFPNFDDMINYGTGWPPSFYPPFWMLDPEEGTLKEYGIRHWLTRDIYLNATYYEMFMDNEILYGADLNGNQRNINVRDVSHSGLELEGFIRITPRWTLKGNYTRQRVIVGTNFRADIMDGRTTEDKWIWQNPAEMANLSLVYENRQWGFSGMIAYHYMGSQFRINDPFNETEPLDSAKWGDFSISQTVFDGLATVYFGIRNFSDAKYALWGTRSDPAFVTVPIAWYPNEGRTYFAGVKANLDYDRMKLPTTSDIGRMQRRLYGSLASGAGALNGMARYLRNMMRF